MPGQARGERRADLLPLLFPPTHLTPRPSYRIVTILATALCFDVGLSSSIITGGLVPVREHFHSSAEVVNLTVCVFVVGFGVGPLFLCPVSEVVGRKMM